MPRDSAGVMSLPPSTWATSGQTINVNQHNPAMREIEQALTDSLPRNGSAGMTAPLNMGGFQIKNIGAPVDAGDAVNLSFARSSTPIGMVIDFAGDFAPEGWVLCDGRSLSRTSESALFAVIGTKFGSDNSETFKIPDLRGRVIAGSDNMGGASAGRITSNVSGFNPNTIGSSGGSQSHTLTVNEMPSHNHNGNTGSDGSHSHEVQYGQNSGESGSRFGWNNMITFARYVASAATSISPNHTHTIPSQGGGNPHRNMQPTMIMNKIIRAR